MNRSPPTDDIVVSSAHDHQGQGRQSQPCDDVGQQESGSDGQGDAAIHTLPGFLGADGRRQFVAAQQLAR